MKLYIRYMVSHRCKIMVESALQEHGIAYSTVDLGVAVLDKAPSFDQRSYFAEALKKMGLELIDDKKTILVEKIKNIVIQVIHYSESRLKKKISDYLAEKLNYSYRYLSNVFAKTESTTIERFVIVQKIERVKDLLMDDELTLTEISYQLDYSSVAHLSSQFKKITGLTPTFYKRLKYNERVYP